jgi:predicted 3-demethylubiquinone-9 3-methyltransferase (glyoxalase superfamily)
MQKIAPFLWFDNQAEEAAIFYTSIFKNSKINKISRYGNEGHEIHGREAGSVMVVSFEIEGQQFAALNGSPHFNPPLDCSKLQDARRSDYYWEKLSEGGEPKAQQCGWL